MEAGFRGFGEVGVVGKMDDLERRIKLSETLEVSRLDDLVRKSTNQTAHPAPLFCAAQERIFVPDRACCGSLRQHRHPRFTSTLTNVSAGRHLKAPAAPTHPMKTGLIRKVVLAAWGLLIVSGLVFYLLRPDLFSPDHIAALLAKFQSEALIVFLAVSIVRGFTLLPSTPLIIAGTLAFPTAPWTVLAISMIGIVASSSLIYWFSEALGIATHFEERKPAAVAKIRSRLEHSTGIAFVFLWAFFPLVPTDAVCYVAGSIRMHFGKFIAAIAGGELILCSFYIFGGSYLTGYFSG